MLPVCVGVCVCVCVCVFSVFLFVLSLSLSLSLFFEEGSMSWVSSKGVRAILAFMLWLCPRPLDTFSPL